MTRLLVDHGAKYKGWAYTPEQQEAVRSLIRESAGRNIYVADSGALRDLTREETGGTITAEPVAKKAAETATAASTAAVVTPPTTAVPEPSTLTPAQQDRMLIERARRVALAYTDNLPNFVCTQTNRSFMSGDGYDWRQTKEAATEVQFVDRRESYRNVTLNGRPSKKRLQEDRQFRRLREPRFTPSFGPKPGPCSPAQAMTSLADATWPFSAWRL